MLLGLGSAGLATDSPTTFFAAGDFLVTFRLAGDAPLLTGDNFRFTGDDLRLAAGVVGVAAFDEAPKSSFMSCEKKFRHSFKVFE